MVALLVALLIGLTLVVRGGDEAPPRLVPRAGVDREALLAFSADRAADFERRAAAGHSHVLYGRSPGGVLVAAERTAAFRDRIEAATDGTSVDPGLLEGLVLLESAGRPEVIAGDDAAGAAGLAQILAETGMNFLGLRIDLAASRRLTGRIASAQAAGDEAAVRRLQAERRRIDERFDPDRALEAAVRYLVTAERRFGRDELAVVSYHMGIGNLEAVLRAYAGVDDGPPVARVVADRDLSYARLYFDSSPTRHPAVMRRLDELGDDSQNYLWKVLAAREIMRLWREDRDELERRDDLHTAKASAEEVLHPPDDTPRLAGPDDVDRAFDRGELQPLPVDPGTSFLRVDPQMGELASRLEREPELYRGLRPGALALLVYLAGRVHDHAGGAPLTVTSTVRDERYQELLRGRNVEATGGYSLHTTGWAFDVLRRYASGRQAQAFQHELERLQGLDLIAWVREPAAIHITVSPRAAELVPALLEEARTDDG